MVASAAVLEAPHVVEAGLRERVDDLLVVLRHDLRLEDQLVVGVVDTEPVRDVARAGDELDRPPGLEEQRNWFASYLDGFSEEAAR